MVLAAPFCRALTRKPNEKGARMKRNKHSQQRSAWMSTRNKEAGTMGHEEDTTSSTAKTKRSEEKDDTAQRFSSNDDESSKRMKLVVDSEPGVDEVLKTTTTTTTTTDRNKSSTSIGAGGNNAAAVTVSPPPSLPPAPIVHLVRDRFPTSAGRSEELDRIAKMKDFVPPPAGTRLAVHWDILLSEDQEDNDEDNDQAIAAAGAAAPVVEPPTPPPAKQKTVTSRWWKATLLPHDGRQMLVSLSGFAVAKTKTTIIDDDDVVLADVRVLEYDALPELGYEESSREDVIFYGPTRLIQCNDLGETEGEEKEKDAPPPVATTLLEYKICSDAEDETMDAENDMNAEAAIDPAETYVVCRRNSTDIEDLVNETLTASLAKVMDRFQLLPASEQLQLAERIGMKKQRLVTLLREHVEQHGVVSEQDMRTLLTQAMAE
jgi:hypothetical protein